VAFRDRVIFAGGRVEALLLSEGEVLRTAEPDEVRFGLAQVRRILSGDTLRVAHVLFSPAEPRPVLLGLVVLSSLVERPLRVEYTELWDVPDGAFEPVEGGCLSRTAEGTRVLADAGSAVRARPPRETPARGLALELTLVLRPASIRRLAFVYAAPPPEEDPGVLVRAWRGRALEELLHVARCWQERLGSSDGAVDAFRRTLRGAGAR
jgi:hypothetical protein